jgi:hypothetical protein
LVLPIFDDPVAAGVELAAGLLRLQTVRCRRLSDRSREEANTKTDQDDV